MPGFVSSGRFFSSSKVEQEPEDDVEEPDPEFNTTKQTEIKDEDRLKLRNDEVRAGLLLLTNSEKANVLVTAILEKQAESVEMLIGLMPKKGRVHNL